MIHEYAASIRQVFDLYSWQLVNYSLMLPHKWSISIQSTHEIPLKKHTYPKSVGHFCYCGSKQNKMQIGINSLDFDCRRIYIFQMILKICDEKS